MLKTIEWKNNRIIFLDQKRLPLEEKYVETDDYRVIAEAIRSCFDWEAASKP